MIDLYCLGGSSVDLVLEVPRLPLEGEKLLAQYYGQLPGGFVANAACAAARLGMKTTWAGAIGDDVFGQKVLQSFAEFGVYTGDVQPQQNSTSDFTVIMVQPNGERTILVVPVLPCPPALNDGMRQSLQNTWFAYTALYDYDWFMEVAGLVHGKFSKKTGLKPDGLGKVAVDLEINTLKDLNAARKMLRVADIIFSDKDALQRLTGQDDVNECVREVLSLGPELIVMTKGNEGASVFTPTETHSTDIYTVPVKDTTGAGDCFHAAFLYGMMCDFQYPHCLKFASAAAALLIQEVGARRGLPVVKEVQEFMENNSIGEEMK
jgi:sugar/nucleoside kinase (ribokinase family)